VFGFHSQITVNQLNFNILILIFYTVFSAVHNNIKDNILFGLVSEHLFEHVLKNFIFVSSASKNNASIQKNRKNVMDTKVPCGHVVLVVA